MILILLLSSTFMMLANLIMEVIVLYSKALLKEEEGKVDIKDASLSIIAIPML